MNEESQAYYAENCRICKSQFSVEVYTVREMMFGFKDEFQYQQCESCGCLQITELPVDIEKYYPPYYYSFNLEIPRLKRLPLLKRWFADIRLKRKYKNLDVLKHLRPLKSKARDRILDVGCGKGKLICELFNQGFINVSGVDKYIPKEIDHGFGVKVLKKDLNELSKSHYDVIMMHHVLEHMEQQQNALKDCSQLLKPNGCLIIAIPLIGRAWELYKSDWVQLDAPRHFFLHTLKSMEILAKQTGFEIRQTIFDSTAFQFLGSELYQQDIPLFAQENNYQLSSFEKFFGKHKIAEFEQEAQWLNKQELGDSAIFYLYKL